MMTSFTLDDDIIYGHQRDSNNYMYALILPGVCMLRATMWIPLFHIGMGL